MSTTAVSTRHLATIWRGAKAWHWAALMYGHAQPRGYRILLKNWRKRMWHFHLTPIHLERDGEKWEIGLCLGKRTLYVKTHR